MQGKRQTQKWHGQPLLRCLLVCWIWHSAAVAAPPLLSTDCNSLHLASQTDKSAGPLRFEHIYHAQLVTPQPELANPWQAAFAGPDFNSAAPAFSAARQAGNCLIPPIVLDLDGDGIAFVPVSDSQVQLDVNHDGLADTVSWPTKGNAVLFADWNKSGILDSRSEFMFGLFSTNKNASDLEGLQLFDYDEDGDMDAEDRIYPSLFLWENRNSDGICTTDEVASLAERNLVLNFAGSRPSGQTMQGNVLQYKFSYRMQYRTAEGTERLVSAGQAYSVLVQAKLQ